jgi:hypothetical protein
MKMLSLRNTLVAVNANCMHVTLPYSAKTELRIDISGCLVLALIYACCNVMY